MPRPVNQTRTGEEVMPTVAYKPNNRLSPEEIEARVWAWVIFVISVILLGSCFSFIYSVTFVTQPMSSMAPIDKVYTKMINDIMLLCTGVLGGVAGRKAVSAAVATATAKAENIDSDNDEPPKP
jgi:hypothetical protein